MRYWWITYNFTGVGITLTPDEAAEFMAAKEDRGVFYIDRMKIQLDTRNYGDIERTEQRYVEGVTMIEASEQEKPPKDSPNPLYCSEHKGVKARWVKRQMPFRVFERRYADMPGQHLLHRDINDDSAVWVVQTRLIYPGEEDGQNLPEGLYDLTDWEKELMSHKLQRR